MLNEAQVIGFIPTRDAEAARTFYEQALGLTFVADVGFALVFRMADGTMLRVVRADEFTPAPFTILGWEVTAIKAKARTLVEGGISALRFPYLEQDEDGVWTAPNGDKVLWFKDPDGNTLSFSEHVAA